MSRNRESNKPKSTASSTSLADAYREAAPYLNIGYTFLGSVLLMVYLGRYLDARWESAPWMTVLGALLGVTAGFYHLFKVVLKSPENHSKN